MGMCMGRLPTVGSKGAGAGLSASGGRGVHIEGRWRGAGGRASHDTQRRAPGSEVVGALDGVRQAGWVHHHVHWRPARLALQRLST